MSDVINSLAGIAPGSPLEALRTQRPEALSHTAGSDDALFNPSDTSGLTLIERHLVGLRVATLDKNAAVAARHRGELAVLNAPAGDVAAAVTLQSPRVSPRLTAILTFTDTLTRAPRTAAPADIDRLKAAGLSDKDVVTLGQLIGYLSYQIRLLAGLRILGGAQ